MTHAPPACRLAPSCRGLASRRAAGWLAGPLLAVMLATGGCGGPRSGEPSRGIEARRLEPPTESEPAPASVRREEASPSGERAAAPNEREPARPETVSDSRAHRVPAPAFESGVASSPSASATMAGGLIEVAPGLRVGVARRIVEFDASVSPLLHDPRNPTFYLEQLVCTPDTKAHESILITSVRPSEIHAAMLAAGLDPGTPGAVNQVINDENNIVTQRIPATGDRLTVRFLYEDPATGGRRSIDPLAWVVNQRSGARFAERDGPGTAPVALHFAGSNIRRFNQREIYDADVAGTIVGLTTFGTEVIGLGEIISHESEIDEPVWIADTASIPPNGTPVTVRIEGQ